MTKKYFLRSVLLSTVLMLVQCVPAKDINSIDLRIRNLDSRIVKLDKTIDKFEGKGQDNPIDTLQRNQADMANMLDKLNSEVLQLKAEIEENSHFYAKLGRENSEFKSSIEMKVTDLSEQISVLADQMNQTSDKLVTIQKETESSALQVKAAQERALAAEKEAERAKAIASTPKDTGRREIVPDQTKLSPKEKEEIDQSAGASGQGPGKEIYDEALSLFRSSKFNEAYRTFTEYIEKFPTGKMAPNARFWLGDCYYSQQEYELAILEYQKVIADFPSHAKAPAALLKQGLAFEKLNDKETATIVYRKLLDDYPKSEQVKTVTKRIESLK
nr:tol-pal system protein YbgF [Desulfobulbaceae bacterium]